MPEDALLAVHDGSLQACMQMSALKAACSLSPYFMAGVNARCMAHSRAAQLCCWVACCSCPDCDPKSNAEGCCHVRLASTSCCWLVLGMKPCRQRSSMACWEPFWTTWAQVSSLFGYSFPVCRSS